MKRFWGFYSNGAYSVGCNGATVYIYDNAGNELKKFRDFPNAGRAAFLPNSNIIAVKSNAGYLGFYDLDKLALIRKHKVSKDGPEDGGFAFSADGRFFYNIETNGLSVRTKMSIYETAGFSKVNTLFADDEKMVLDHLEIDPASGTCYVSGFLRRREGNDDFAAIFDQKALCIRDIRVIDHKTYEYLCEYKNWELSGFTDRMTPRFFAIDWMKDLQELGSDGLLKKLLAIDANPKLVGTIPPISIKEVFEKY